jgi:hypothetical protein
MNHKIQTTFTATTAASIAKTGEEYMLQMMRLIAEFNNAESEACREYMLALMKANGVRPETHVALLNVNDIPPHWRQHMPEFVLLSPLITSRRVYFADRKTFDLIAGS